MSIFADKTGIKLWSKKPIDLTVLSCPHCSQEMPSHKNIEAFLNYLYNRYSTRYVAKKGIIVWDESRQLEDFEDLLEGQTGVFVSEFSPLPIFLTHNFDYASYPEYRKDGMYLIAFIHACYEMPDTLRYIEHLKELFETVQWYTEYLYKHYEEAYDFWYELVDQNGKEIIPMQEICYAYL